MEPAWYFMNGATRTGPLSTEELLTALLATPEPRLTRVWREGLPDWERAGALPEFQGKLPPRATSISARDDDRELGAMAQPKQVESEARAVASLYRRLVLLIGCQLLIGIVVRLIDQQNPSDVEAIIGLIGLVCALVVVGLIVFTAYRLMKELRSGAPILWALAMFIPLLNILFLLAISSKAQAWCKQHGIAVGFFGPTRESLDRLSAGPGGTA